MMPVLQPERTSPPQPANSNYRLRMQPTQSSLYVQSLGAGIAVLRAFDANRPAMNLPEIAAASGVTRSTAQRLAFTLQALGLLKKDAKTKRYSLAPDVLDMACHYLEAHPLVDRANAVLLELNRETGETVNLAEPAGLDMMYICRFPSPMRLLVHMPLGRRIPMFCSSSGRTWLSGLPDSEIAATLERSELTKFTEHTITDRSLLMKEIHRVRDNRFACCINEYYQGDLALAVPVYGRSGRMEAALQLSVPSSKWEAEQAIKHFVPKMQAAASLMQRAAPSADYRATHSSAAPGPKDQVAAPPGTAPEL